MKKILKKLITPKLIVILTILIATIDTHFQLLKEVGLPIDIINYIKLTGIMLVAFLPSILSKKLNTNSVQAGAPEEIGGGGIKNPPKG